MSQCEVKRESNKKIKKLNKKKQMNDLLNTVYSELNKITVIDGRIKNDLKSVEVRKNEEMNVNIVKRANNTKRGDIINPYKRQVKELENILSMLLPVPINPRKGIGVKEDN